MVQEYVFSKPAAEWIKDLTDDQFVRLSDLKDKQIEITGAFYYKSKKIGAEGVTFKFLMDGKEWYTSSFSEVILKQFREGLMDALDKDSVLARVTYKTSKNGKEYPMFSN